MRRILLVAEGTMDRPLVNVTSIVLGIIVTVALGMTIISLELHVGVTIAALVALLIGIAVLKGRFGGPREFRVEKPADGGPLRVTGRFVDGEIPAGKPRELGDVAVSSGQMRFTTRNGETRDFHITEPAFTQDSMTLLQGEIEQLRDTSEAQTCERYASGTGHAIKFYDAKQIVLLRYTEKPSYMILLWMISGITVLGLLLVGLLFGG